MLNIFFQNNLIYLFHLKTPARVPKGHMSTGHADSPATIVVGRAHKTAVAVGAAPRVVTNTILIKKNMKMDEDLTGNFSF